MKDPQIVLKVSLLGDPGVGKTSLVNRYIDEIFEKDYRPTLGVNIMTKDIESKRIGKKVRLVIWDIAGQEKYDFTRKMFFQGCKGVFLIYDITRPNSLTNIKNKWLKDLRQFSQDDMKFILIGNKNDLQDQKQITREEGEKFADSINAIDLIETSAKEGDNVNHAFESLVSIILGNST
jgi:small GTP-binding protein